ncbi:MAG: GGDEF domain-containing protein, partial [Pseudothermotoga sp.]
LGHLCGDDLLKHVTNVVKEQMRRSDLLARFGGDEFLIIFPHTSQEQAQFVMDRIIQNLQRSKPECLKNLEVSISYGLAEVIPDKSVDVDQIIKLVDEKMYQHKKEKQGMTPPLRF